jgi:hypothetical protein
MFKSKKNKILSLLIITLLIVGGITVVAQVSNKDLHGWSWSSNIGWISMNWSDPLTEATATTSYKVTLNTDGSLTGYLWAPNIGWISFNPADLDDAPACPFTEKAFVNTTTGAVTGWARALAGIGGEGYPDYATTGSFWNGCIQLSSGTTGYFPTLSPSGFGGVTLKNETVGTQIVSKLVGFAWGGNNVGWIELSDVFVDTQNTSGLSVNCFSNLVSSDTTSKTYNFTTSVSGGVSPYLYSWNNGSYTSTDNRTQTYTSNGPGPLVQVKDSGSTQKTGSKYCPSVTSFGGGGGDDGCPGCGGGGDDGCPGCGGGTDTSDGVVKLYIGRNASSTSKTLQITQGTRFTLNWLRGGLLNCTTSVTPAATLVNNEGMLWDNSMVNLNLYLSGIVTDRMTPGQYTLTLTCDDGAEPPTATSSSAILRLTSSTIIEI